MHVHLLVSLHSIYVIYIFKEPHCKCTVYIFSMAETQPSWQGRRKTINKPLYRKQPFQPSASGIFSLLCETPCFLEHAGNEEAGGQLNCVHS